MNIGDLLMYQACDLKCLGKAAAKAILGANVKTVDLKKLSGEGLTEQAIVVGGGLGGKRFFIDKVSLLMLPSP